MLSQRTDRKRNHGGFTLIEMLVASAVFAIAAAVAFILYTAAQKSYKMGENFTEQQQSTRVAFDRMISDLRLAGFNFNPDGDKTRVDEQIEGAWDTAVTIRGDFDFEDPTASATPEAALPGTAYTVVSTGNDEIVTYVLSKPGVSGPDDLVLVMDVDKPRDKTTATVTIPDVALVQDDPPYTLYRVTLTDVAGTFPSSPQASSNFVYEPVADNIRSMSFQFHDDGGNLINPDTPADASDDIGGADANQVARDRIRRITVNLVGMTPDEDPNFVDASDAIAATQHFRKFDLQSDVNAENLGKSGVKDIDVTPPGSPTNVALVPDHCSGMLVTWDPPSSTAGVSSYAIKYYVSGSPSAFSTVGTTYPHLDYGLIDYDGHGFVSGLTMGTDYCFQVQAKDAAGNQSGWAPGSTPPCATVSEASTPGQPQNLAATGNGTLAPLDSVVDLTWDEVKSNANTVSGDPDLIGGTTILRDSAGYKLYRDTSSGFTPDDATNMIADPSLLGTGSIAYSDPTVTNCVDYYYKLVAVDTCTIAGAASIETSGRSETSIAPAKPTGLTGTRVSPQNVDLSWTAVTQNANGDPITVGLYKIYAYLTTSFQSPGSLPVGSFTLRGTSTTNAYTDSLLTGENAQLNQGNSLYYIVSAADLCGNESVKSDPIEIYCDFQGTLVGDPSDGETVSGVVPIDLTVSGGGPYTRARVRIENDLNPGVFVYDQEVFSYPFLFPAWDSTADGAGTYTIYWEVEDDKGCTGASSSSLTVTANLACQITPTNPNLSPTNGKPSNQNKFLSWDIVNNSGKDLEITEVEVDWTSNLSASRLLTDLQYPTGTTVTSLGGGVTRPATVDFSFFPLLLPMGADGLCGNSSCVVNMTLGWDVQVVDTAGTGELITITYKFRDATSAVGTCTFSVSPDLTIAVP